MSQGFTPQEKSTDNALHPVDVLPIALSTVLIICNIVVTVIFYKNRAEPAFDKRKIKLTLLICLLLNIPMLSNALHHIMFMDIITQIFVIYCLFLTILRAWNLIYGYQIGHLDLDATGSNFWVNNYYRLGSQTFTNYYCTVSFLVICIPPVFLSIYSSHHTAFLYIYIMHGIYIIGTLIIVQLLKHINMQDQLHLAKEIKTYAIVSTLLIVFMIIIFTLIIQTDYSEHKYHLQRDRGPKPNLVANILITINIFIMSISFILYPIYKYHKMSSQANELAQFIDSSEENKEDETDNPTLKQFISKNKKCYDHFKSHLQQSWAVENLLFYSDSQLFRVNGNEFNDPEKHCVLKIRFDYLQDENENGSTQPSTCTLEVIEKDSPTQNEESTIEKRWFYLYNRYFSCDGLYQINIESDGFAKVEEFKQKILNKHQNVTENEYYESLESALIQIWALMEGLYVYFRLRNDYKQIITRSYLEKQTSEVEMETVVERIEDFFDDI